MTILIIIVILAVAFLVLTYLCFRKVFHELNNRKKSTYTIPNGEQYQSERERMLALIKETDDIPYEEVYIDSFDGLRLFAKYYHVKDHAPIHIQMHGYRANGVRDFCGGNKIAREAGHNTLLVDHRAHGRSDGHVITFGVKEQHDCLSWANYAADRFGKDTPIFLSGISMGAATVLLATRLDLPANVVGVIADCPYSSAKGIICKVISDMKLPQNVVFGMLRFGAKLFGRFDVNDANVIEAVARAKVPVLLIHGEEDRFVPWEMSKELAEVNPELVALELFPGAGHGISYIVDTKRYENKITSFVEKCLGGFLDTQTMGV